MGLDVVFDRQQALDAGLITKIERNGTDEQAAEARRDEEQDKAWAQPGYADWLSSTSELMQVPGTDFWFMNDGSENQVVVSASKRGDIYHPLTWWLTSKRVPWTEHQ